MTNKIFPEFEVQRVDTSECIYISYLTLIRKQHKDKCYLIPVITTTYYKDKNTDPIKGIKSFIRQVYLTLMLYNPKPDDINFIGDDLIQKDKDNTCEKERLFNKYYGHLIPKTNDHNN